MTIRQYSPDNPVNTYSAEKEITYLQLKLSEIMIMIGLDPSNMSTTTIDDIIHGIRLRYPFTKSDVEDGIVTISPPAAYINNINLYLVSTTRKLWWRYQIAKVAELNA